MYRNSFTRCGWDKKMWSAFLVKWHCWFPKITLLAKKRSLPLNSFMAWHTLADPKAADEI